MTKIVRWDDPPIMEAGSPLPAIELRDDRLLLAYVCHNPEFPGWDPSYSIEHPGFDCYSAVLEFRGLIKHSIGPPNDHDLHTHPLYDLGLTSDGFFEVVSDSLTKACERRWIVTFKEETLDVVAKDASVIQVRVDGEDTESIIARTPYVRRSQWPLLADSSRSPGRKADGWFTSYSSRSVCLSYNDGY